MYDRRFRTPYNPVENRVWELSMEDYTSLDLVQAHTPYAHTPYAHDRCDGRDISSTGGRLK